VGPFGGNARAHLKRGSRVYELNTRRILKKTSMHVCVRIAYFNILNILNLLLYLGVYDSIRS
jgi:hypothetical protein